MKTANQSNNEKLLSASGVGEKLNCSKRSVYRYAYSATIPAPVRLSGSTKWKLSDISLFLDCDCDMLKFQARKEAEDVR